MQCPILVLVGILGYISKDVYAHIICLLSHRHQMTPTIMSSKHFKTVPEELQRAYKAVLLHTIVYGLNKDQQKELRFYYNTIIKNEDTDALGILLSLENARKISWKDVHFLKEGLREIRRCDLAKTLTKFEIKRNLTILLDFYASKKHGLKPSCRSASVEKVARYMSMLMTEIVGDRLNVSDAVRSLVESRKGFKQVLVDFEEESERKLSDPWSKLTLLVVISGETVAVALADKEHRRRPEILKLLLPVADELCFRMLKLGNWEEFCDHVEERYNLVYHQQNLVSDDASSLSVKKKVADVVQHLMETSFFS